MGSKARLSRDTDVCAQLHVWARPQIAHSRDQLKTNARGALDCVFLRMQITEKQPGDMATRRLDHFATVSK